MIQSSSLLVLITAVVVLSVAVATALVSSTSTSSPATEQNGWSVSGSGFHRTATFRLTKEKVGASSSLSSLSSKSNNNNNDDVISIILAVPKDFYIDVNELWKRSSLKISSSSFEFIGSNSDAFIDIEGPSFRSKTVPQITKVELKFRSSSQKQQQQEQSKKETSFFELTLPVHARYNSPVGELVSSTTSGLSISSLSSQLTDLLQFRENYVDLSFNLKFESLKKIIVNDVKEVVKATDLSSIFNSNKPFNWIMPVGNNEHAQVVFWITTSLVILGAVSVIVAAVLPVGSGGGEKRGARSLSR